MKKSLRPALLLCLILALSACGGNAAPDGAAARLRVGIVNTDPGESGYRAANVRDFEETFTAENGYDASFFYSAENDAQIAAVRDLLQGGVDYLLLSAAEPGGWEDVLREAQAAGVPVILFDRMVEAGEDLYAAAILPDPAREGEAAVRWLADLRLEAYRIVHLQGALGSDAQLGRSGALQAMADAEGWQLAAQLPADWSRERARQAVQAVIDAGADFNVIYAENDNMALGAQAALDQAGIPYGADGGVVIVSFDCTQFALQNVVDGKWRYEGQSSPFQATLADTVLQDLARGVPPAARTVSPEARGFTAESIKQSDVEKYGI